MNFLWSTTSNMRLESPFSLIGEISPWPQIQWNWMITSYHPPASKEIKQLSLSFVYIFIDFGFVVLFWWILKLYYRPRTQYINGTSLKFIAIYPPQPPEFWIARISHLIQLIFLFIQLKSMPKLLRLTHYLLETKNKIRTVYKIQRLRTS